MFHQDLGMRIDLVLASSAVAAGSGSLGRPHARKEPVRVTTRR